MNKAGYIHSVGHIVTALDVNVFQSRTLFFLFETRLGFNVCACTVHDAECACVVHPVADVAVEVVEVRLAVLTPVLYYQKEQIGPGES